MTLNLSSIDVIDDTPSGKYLGRKGQAGVKERIISHMCPHDIFIESHAGTGVIIANKPPAAFDYAIEIDADVIARFHRCYGEHAITLCGDWQEVIKTLLPVQCADPRRVLVYHDPPYHPDTRSSHHKYKFDHTADDHQRFLWACKMLPFRQMISGYNHPIYDKILPDWHRIDYQTKTRAHKTVTESLWLNYAPTIPHWHSFAGVDSTDRTRIRRKGERQGRLFKEMPQAERLAVLQHVFLAIDEPA